MSTELFMEDVINPVLYLLAFALIVTTWGMAVCRWWCTRRKEKQVEHMVEGYPFHEFWLDLCNYAECDYTEAEAQDIYRAWQEWVVQREEVKQ